MLIRLIRIPHSLGFGVQSPSAYYFIKYVIEEKLPYYLYDDLQIKFPDVKTENRKFYKLCFRIANYAQASDIMIIGDHDSVLTSYIRSACKKAVVNFSSCNDFTNNINLKKIDNIDILISDVSYIDPQTIESLLQLCIEKSILIFTGIRNDKKSVQVWKSLVNDNAISDSFDLYDYGIITFMDKQSKGNYSINF